MGATHRRKRPGTAASATTTAQTQTAAPKTAAAHAAVALVIRTVALRACLLVGTYAVTIAGPDTEVEARNRGYTLATTGRTRRHRKPRA